MQELQDFIDAYCIEFPSACSGSPDAASDSVPEAELDDAAGEDSCSPEASVACLDDVTAAIMGVIAAKGEVAALWEASKQVVVITARKLGKRVFSAITGYGTAALLAALAAECIVYQLMQSEPVDLGPMRPRFLAGRFGIRDVELALDCRGAAARARRKGSGSATAQPRWIAAE